MPKYVPLESERPLKVIHASHCVFVETEYRPGHEPEPEPEPEEEPTVEETTSEEPTPEEEEVVPDESWNKSDLINYAKEHDIYKPEMEERGYTKADILDDIKNL